ncbi:MAG: bifunctional riboflavin kinase/FAD synthetase [Chloroflexi bacterium]|nr:bifunctional riboflavin kinase/FAD synthetase [Chloroflexota bacterium]MCC6896470.1 bifunctional riboflavin kinase/FAD synthetase [Anaerolineae bacterium]
MSHVYSLADANLPKQSIVTIGVFDGVHRGHQHLIKRLVDEAHSSGRLAVVLTFFPHPDVVIRGLTGRYYLNTPEQKADLLIGFGVDCVVTHPFNDTVRQVRAADFVDELLGQLKMSALWVGSDFAMGYKREGNVPFLREQGAQKGFSVHDVDLIEAQGGIISSSAIRQAVQFGEMEQAKEWLGRAYSVTGEVVHGEKRGRQIGYPTANTAVWDELVLPANGIYAGWATLGNERFMAMTNVGVRPTFDGKNITVEPYLLDFNRDIYGEQLEVSFEKRLRPEAKFDNLQDLIDQIGRDVEVGRAFLETLS